MAAPATGAASPSPRSTVQQQPPGEAVGLLPAVPAPLPTSPAAERRGSTDAAGALHAEATEQANVPVPPKAAVAPEACALVVPAAASMQASSMQHTAAVASVAQASQQQPASATADGDAAADAAGQQPLCPAAALPTAPPQLHHDAPPAGAGHTGDVIIFIKPAAADAQQVCTQVAA